jgi:8-oxoguanine deaminase
LTQPLWIRDPLAILADGAERGFVVESGRIVELVPKGGTPATPTAAAFDAHAHVVIPGLINTHHHFYQTLTRALPAALDRELFPWLRALYPVWARLTPDALDLAVTVAMAELLVRLHNDHGSSLCFPPGSRRCHRHRSRVGAAARHSHRSHPRFDELVAA